METKLPIAALQSLQMTEKVLLCVPANVVRKCVVLTRVKQVFEQLINQIHSRIHKVLGVKVSRSFQPTPAYLSAEVPVNGS
jgi:hypothetical protein